MVMVKVSPKQMEYYERIWPEERGEDNVEIIKRMINEFNLSLALAREVFDDYPESFELSGNRNRPLVPAHSRDQRETVFIGEELLETIDQKMEKKLDADPYENFPDITEDIQTEIFEELQDENLIEDDEGSEQVKKALDQYPFGVYPVVASKAQNVEEMQSLLNRKVEEGHELTQVISEFFQSVSHWEEDQKVVVYIAAAEVLYEHAQKHMDDLRDDIG